MTASENSDTCYYEMDEMAMAEMANNNNDTDGTITASENSNTSYVPDEPSDELAQVLLSLRETINNNRNNDKPTITIPTSYNSYNRDSVNNSNNINNDYMSQDNDGRKAEVAKFHKQVKVCKILVDIFVATVVIVRLYITGFNKPTGHWVLNVNSMVRTDPQQPSTVKHPKAAQPIVDPTPSRVLPRRISPTTTDRIRRHPITQSRATHSTIADERPTTKYNRADPPIRRLSSRQPTDYH
ncbi:uncharacterized protein [Musca autumnalis]|uniref:uncharacterized protein n=1 Tax=Musca autumnalis TaxID=221902 RepID=UPI003CF52D24